VTTARRAARQVEPAAAAGVPVELMAGPCFEVWGTDVAATAMGPWIDVAVTALGRWSAARRAWLAAHGWTDWDTDLMPEVLADAWRTPVRVTPWSFTYLAGRDPDALAGRLERLGLPRRWTPTLAWPVDYGPSLLPPRLTYRSWRAWRAGGAPRGHLAAVLTSTTADTP
jgi:hypothetical protein